MNNTSKKQIVLSIATLAALFGLSTWQYYTRYSFIKAIGGIGTAVTLINFVALNKKFNDDEYAEDLREKHQSISHLQSEVRELNQIIDGLNIDLDFKENEKKALSKKCEVKVENVKSILQVEIEKLNQIIKEKEEEFDKNCDLYLSKLKEIQDKHYHEMTAVKNEYGEKTLKLLDAKKEFKEYKKSEEDRLRDARFMLDRRQFESNNEFNEKREQDLDKLRAWQNELIEKERLLHEQDAQHIAQEKDWNYQLEAAKNHIGQLSQTLEVVIQERDELQKRLRNLVNGLDPDSLEFALVKIIRECFAGYGYNLTYKLVQGRTQNRISFLFDAEEEEKEDIIKKKDALSADRFDDKPVNIFRKNGYLEVDVPYNFGQSSTKKVEFTPGQVHFKSIETFVRNAQHLLLIGATGNGKSTLISNLLELASEVLEGTPELVILNPKPTAVDYSFNGQVYRANYVNIVKPDSCLTPDCSEGLERMIEDLNNRMIEGQRAFEEGQDFPKFQPKIYLLEEGNVMNSELKDQWRKAIQLVARLGREFNFFAIVLGQEATIKEYGFTSRSSVQNFSRIYLKSALNLDVVDGAELKYLSNAEEIRRDIQKHKENVSTSKATQYYGLFIEQSTGQAFVSCLPEPSHYYNLFSNVTCIACGSNHVKKDGQRKGKDYYRCNECDHAFSKEQFRASLKSD